MEDLLEGLKQELQGRIDMGEDVARVPEIIKKIEDLNKEIKTLKRDAREAVSTTWRFIGAYKKENSVPIKNALKSAEFHLSNIDYIFKD